MNFDISEEQELLQETLKQYVENECPPTRIRELFDSGEGWDPTFWKGLVEMGVAGLVVPEEHGGAGLELLDLALAAESLAYGGAPGPFFGHSLACLAISLGGSDAQKAKWLPGLATGEALGSVALGEAGGAWQPEQWEVSGDGSVSGSKICVPHAGRADVIVVGVAGPGLVLVERVASGVEVQPFEGVDRVRPLDTVVFEGAACEALPEGAAAAPRLRDAGLVLLAADAFGSATRLVDMCVEYAKNREQFGVTIGHFQALKHQLSSMALEIEPSRGLYWYAAHAFDHILDESERSAAIAKAHITDRAMQISRDAVEAHGGIGFTWECDVQLWFKRAMFDRAFLGQPSVHRERSAQLAGW
ncbi:MAG: acyl-CoA/acyl-ACP dehydrogenase [Deltaproteobacteria bacterium]|nr:acyl-CoA/acyl-ACP dehydrogenase [Deltaproteobacteria bacterium]MBW2362350.1 acyl-CoA/acyl-ACP dehydrogenase [Deltaproteobacteria bacterium]